MTNKSDKINVELDEETFAEMVKLLNIYSTALSQAHKVLFVLSNLPRENGRVILDENCFNVIDEVLIDYQGVKECAHKLEAKPTLH